MPLVLVELAFVLGAVLFNLDALAVHVAMRPLPLAEPARLERQLALPVCLVVEPLALVPVPIRSMVHAITVPHTVDEVAVERGSIAERELAPAVGELPRVSFQHPQAAPTRRALVDGVDGVEVTASREQRTVVLACRSRGLGQGVQGRDRLISCGRRHGVSCGRKVRHDLALVVAVLHIFRRCAAVWCGMSQRARI